jgi:hypothetical protein
VGELERRQETKKAKRMRGIETEKTEEETSRERRCCGRGY